MGTRKSVFQVDRKGRAPRVPVAFGEDNPHDRTRLNEHLQPHAGGTPKDHNAVKIHGGMHRMQNGRLMHGSAGDGDMARGQPHQGPPDASAANPLDKEALGKRLAPVRFTPGMRSRTNADRETHDDKILAGQRMLAEATRTR
jgi:hypothetical protein